MKDSDLVKLALCVKEASDSLEDVDPTNSLILSVLAVLLIEMDEIKERLEVQ